MNVHITRLGYVVKETTYGLNIYENGDFVCELAGARIADFTYNGKVDDKKLEDAIEKVEIENLKEFLANMGNENEDD